MTVLTSAAHHPYRLPQSIPSGLNVRVWAWSYTDNDGTRGVAVRILDDDDDTAPTGEAWAYIR